MAFKEDMKAVYHMIYGLVCAFYHKCVPEKLKRGISPVVENIAYWKNSLLVMLRQVHYEGFNISGRIEGSNIDVLYIGHKSRLPFVARIGGLADASICSMGKVYPWNIGKAISNCHGADIVFFDLPFFYVNRLKKKERGLLLVPEWVNFHMKVDDAAMDSLQSLSGLREELRRIRKYRYSFEIKKNKQDLDYFYHSMYVPYTKLKHANLPYIHSLPFLNRLFRTGVILYIRDAQGDLVAGNMLLLRNQTVKAICIGIKDGDFSYVKKGVVDAKNYFLLKWAKENNFREIDFGNTRAFMNDGVFLYKRKWGAIVREQYRGTLFFGMKLLKLSEGAQKFLNKNPFIFSREGKLEGFVFLKEYGLFAEHDIETVYRNYWTEGLERLNIMRLSGFSEDFRNSVEKTCPGLHLVDEGFFISP